MRQSRRYATQYRNIQGLLMRGRCLFLNKVRWAGCIGNEGIICDRVIRCYNLVIDRIVEDFLKRVLLKSSLKQTLRTLKLCVLSR